MNPGNMITKKIKLNQVESEGFQTLISHREKHVKIPVDIAADLS